MSPQLSPGITVRETDFSFYVKQISTSSAAMVGVAERGPINKTVLVTSWEQFINTFGGYIAAGYLAYAARAFFDNGGAVLWVNRIAHLTDPTDRSTLTAEKSAATLTGRDAAAASLQTGTPGTDAITWTAQAPGTAGNAISVALVPEGNDTPLSVEITDTAITVHLATDGTGAATSTADEVAAAVMGDLTVSALVAAVTEDTGVVAAAASTNLIGGADAADALEVSAINEGAWADRLSVEIADGSQDPANTFDLTVRYKGNVVEVFKDLSMDESAANHVELAVNDKSDWITTRDLSATTGLATDRPATGTYTLSGGVDGLADLSDIDYMGDPSQHTGFYAFDEVDALNMLLAPGVTTAPVISGAIAYAESRKDLIFVADAPIHLEPQEAVDFRKGQGLYSHAAFNSSYAAIYYPWLEITDPMTGKKKLVPPSGAVAGCYARSDQKTQVWYAPAGIDRGRILNALSVAYKTSRGERDVLYPEGVNVIAVFPDTGINTCLPRRAS